MGSPNGARRTSWTLVPGNSPISRSRAIRAPGGTRCTTAEAPGAKSDSRVAIIASESATQAAGG
jgi:hypothetical protein